MELDDDQLKAVDACCNLDNRIVAITGCAGTGKTSIMQQVYEKLHNQDISVALCAPTGKAAKRITEATGLSAQTQHRLLEYPHPGDKDAKTGKPLRTTEPARCRRYPLTYQVVLADEYTMCNSEVHRNLLDALPSGGCIRMFGDANQLQPIEPTKKLQEQPSPFNLMLDKFHGITLHKIHRQAENSSIITNGRLITLGQMPRRTEEFNLKITENPVEEILGIVLDGEVDYGITTNQIISPVNVGWTGTVALNTQIQLLMHPSSKPYVELERHKWSKQECLRIYVGDKIIFTSNNYALEIFNGESGIVTEASDLGTVRIDFGDKEVDVPLAMEVETRSGTAIVNPQMDIELAYVITTHKSQGSEYDNVIYVMNRSRAFNLNRKNFYTATSRAKKKVTVVTDQKGLSLSLYKKG